MQHLPEARYQPHVVLSCACGAVLSSLSQDGCSHCEWVQDVDIEEEIDDGLPWACFICRGDFKDPVVTKCRFVVVVLGLTLIAAVVVVLTLIAAVIVIVVGLTLLAAVTISAANVP